MRDLGYVSYVRIAVLCCCRVTTRRPEEISGMTQHNMDRDPDAGTCTDLHARCTEWAAAGECENNKAYMCGGSNNLGACRKSCKVCESCRSGDMECINRNRVRGGYWKLDKVRSEQQRARALIRTSRGLGVEKAGEIVVRPWGLVPTWSSGRATA